MKLQKRFWTGQIQILLLNWPSVCKIYISKCYNFKYVTWFQVDCGNSEAWLMKFCNRRLHYLLWNVLSVPTFLKHQIQRPRSSFWIWNTVLLSKPILQVLISLQETPFSWRGDHQKSVSSFLPVRSGLSSYLSACMLKCLLAHRIGSCGSFVQWE